MLLIWFVVFSKYACKMLDFIKALERRNTTIAVITKIFSLTKKQLNFK